MSPTHLKLACQNEGKAGNSYITYSTNILVNSDFKCKQTFKNLIFSTCEVMQWILQHSNSVVYSQATFAVTYVTES